MGAGKTYSIVYMGAYDKTLCPSLDAMAHGDDVTWLETGL